MTALVIIPAYNEERHIGPVVRGVREALPRADVLVVDDGSLDRTRFEARAAGARVVSHVFNLGYGAALQTGYKRADRDGYEYVIQLDADGQHPVHELARLLEIVEAGEADVAVGSRFVSGEGYPEYRYKPSPARSFGTGLLRRGMKAALGRPFHDATSGLYAVDAKAMPILAKPYDSGAPEVESLLRLREAGLTVVEVPVNMRERASGESKLRGRKAVQLVATVAGTLVMYGVWRRLRRR